ncbi:VMAP-C domain-containing protein [Streptomyces phaeochromogenes]|uniref:VMAP-C domain-containing protein n=1 Tax=Streptomyces phaeochromogenes TaxID=1923 RepID=UPI0036B3107F
MSQPTGKVVRFGDGERTPLTGLPAALTEAFRECDEPGRPAVLQVVLPHPLLELDVDAWKYCESTLDLPPPPAGSLRDLPHTTVPVLCRYGGQPFEDDPVALVRIVHGGFGVARWRGQTDAVCGEFHRRAGDTVAGAGSAERLPELVHALRAGLRAGKPETFWAKGIALLYDDPRQPLPGTGDLMRHTMTFYGQRPASSPAAAPGATRSP